MASKASYNYSAEYRVHLRDTHRGIAYSDGAAIEGRLLELMRSCQDVSDASPELRRHINDWPSEYHFSPLRANLLRPFSFKDKRVLELGCGCGAISRFLGEGGARLTAVEGSLQRAGIAAERCRDLPDVRIYCDNFADFQAEHTFDVVTLIGVLEYSRKFIPGSDPVQRCLELACAQLDDEGELYIAIENQLGLKYWNGCAEDHTGHPFFGIQDCYTGDGVVTFGRKELTERIKAAGFEDVEFYFPFPDYKLPELMVSEAGLADPQMRIGDLLCRVNSRDYGRVPLNSFHEGLAWQAAARNGMVGDMANSFLVRARKKTGSPRADWLACTYSSGRLRELATANRIFRCDDRISVAKQRIFGLPVTATRFSHHEGLASYIEGDLLIVELQRIAARGGGIAEIAAWARPWLAFLEQHANQQGELPGAFVDCVPTNLIRDAAGQLHYIDAEWSAASPIRLSWIAVRGLMISASACPPLHAIGRMSYRQFIAAILGAAGIQLAPEDWSKVAEWEDALRLHCYGEFRPSDGFASQLDRIDLPWTTYPSCLDALNIANGKLRRIQRMPIWKLMAPLRFFYNSLHKRGWLR